MTPLQDCLGTLGLLLVMALGATVAQPAVISHVTDPTKPGKVFNVVGADADERNPQVRVARVKDGRPGNPTDKPATPALDDFQSAEVLKHEPQVLTCAMPPMRLGVFAVQMRGASATDDWSNTILINRPRADWLSTDRAEPGQAVRVLGRNLVGLDLYSERDAAGLPVSYGGYVSGKTQVALRRGATVVQVAVEKMSGYDVHFRLPKDLPTGEYEAFVHNGYGGPAGWSNALKLTVRAAQVWPTKQFNVREFGAVGDGKADDAPAIQAALDAASANGGGIVLLPPGSYLINKTLTVAPRTVVRGNSRERTWIWLPNGVHYGTREAGLAVEVGIQGNGDFTLEDLTLHGVYVKNLVQAPVDFGARSSGDVKSPRADNVTIRRCQLLVEPTLRHPYRKGDPFLEQERLDRDSNWCYRFCAALRGDYHTVEDCIVRGGGSCFYLEAGRYCAIRRNELLHGTGVVFIIWPLAHAPRGHYPAAPMPEKLIIEDNSSRPVSNVHSATLWSHATAKRFYLARNRFEMDWCRDNECVCWHSLALRWTARAVSASAASLEFSAEDAKGWREGLKTNPQSKGASANVPFFDDAAGKVKPGALTGFECLVIEGRGVGQMRMVLANTESSVTLDRPWEIPPTGSLVAFTQNPQFEGHIVVDNWLDHTGSGIVPWGNGYDMVIDGNRLSRSGGINLSDVGQKGSYREWAGNYFIQVLHNTLTQGRYHGKWDPGAAYGIFQGTIGVARYGASAGVAGLGLVMRENRTESDSLICLAPTGAAKQHGAIIEDNACTTSRSGIRVSAGASGVLRGNTFQAVDEPLLDEGSSLWIHPAERLRAWLDGTRTLLDGEGMKAEVDWRKLQKQLDDAARRPVFDSSLAQTVREQVWQAISRANQGEVSWRVLDALTGITLKAVPGSLESLLATGKGGKGALAVHLRLAADAPRVQVAVKPHWPPRWEAAEPATVTLSGGEEAKVEPAATVPAGAWGAYALPVTVTVRWGEAELRAKTRFNIGRGYVTEWYVAGPFVNAKGADLDETAHPPENRVDLKAEYPGLGGKVGWRASSGTGRLDFGKLLSTTDLPAATSAAQAGKATAYAVSVLRASEAVDVVLSVSAKDGARVWLNYSEVGSIPRGPGSLTKPVRLEHGDNLLMLKVSNKGGNWHADATIAEQGPDAGGRVLVVPASELAKLPQLNPPRAAQTAEISHAGGLAWQLVHADDFQGVDLSAWKIACGDWKVVNGAVSGSATGRGAFLAYKQPVKAPVRIEYDGRSASPADLSAFWLADPQNFSSGYLFAFAAGGGTNRVDVLGGTLLTSEKVKAKPNQWHHVIAQIFPTGRVQVIVDGQVCLEGAGPPPGDPPRYAGIWTWDKGDFDNVRIYTAPR